MALTKKQKGIAIGIVAVIVIYFLFFRKPAPKAPVQNADGTMNVISETPLTGLAGDPNAVNSRTGQPVNRG